MLAFVDRCVGSALDWLNAHFGQKPFQEEEALRLRQVADEVRTCLGDYLEVHKFANERIADFVANGFEGSSEQALLFTYNNLARVEADHAGYLGGPSRLVRDALDTFNTAMVGGTAHVPSLPQQKSALHRVFHILTATHVTHLPPGSSYVPPPLVLDYMQSFFHAHQALRGVAEGTLGRDGMHWSHRPPSLGAGPPQV